LAGARYRRSGKLTPVVPGRTEYQPARSATKASSVFGEIVSDADGAGKDLHIVALQQPSGG
jgi:hypothetical protein